MRNIVILSVALISGFIAYEHFEQGQYLMAAVATFVGVVINSIIVYGSPK